MARKNKHEKYLHLGPRWHSMSGRCNFILQSKPAGRPCRRWPKKGFEFCPYHVNKSKKGELNPNWKGGVSKSFAARYMPERLIKRFEEAFDDPELVSVRTSLAILATRYTELLEKLGTQESGEAWEAIGIALDHIEECMTTPEEEQVRVAVYLLRAKGHGYIGTSLDPNERYIKHRSRVKRGKSKGGTDVFLYGKPTMEILGWYPNSAAALAAEVEWKEEYADKLKLTNRAAWKESREGTEEAARVRKQKFQVRSLEDLETWVTVLRDNYKAAMHERGVWNDLSNVIEQHRKVADTERRREESLQVSLNMQQATLLFNAMFLMITEEVKDADARGRMSARLNQLLLAEAPQADIQEADFEVIDDG